MMMMRATLAAVLLLGGWWSIAAADFFLQGSSAQITGASISCGSSCSLAAQTASSSPIGTATATMSSGSFTGTWSITTSGTDHSGTTCHDATSYYSTFAINSSTGALNNDATSVAKNYTALCLVATQGGSSFVQAISVDGRMKPPSGYTFTQMQTDDNFTSASLNTSNWHPWYGNHGFGRLSDFGNLPSPYSGSNCGPSPGTSGTNCLASGYYNNEYYDPYPYGYATNTTGSHMTGGSGKLAFITNPQNYFNGGAGGNIGFTWAGASITGYDLIVLPTAGWYIQVRVKMPDCRYGMWYSIWFIDQNFANEFDLQECGFTDLGASSANQLMHSHWIPGGQNFAYNTGVDMSAAYHVLAVQYCQGVNWKSYFDGTLTNTYTGSMPPNTTAYDLILDTETANANASGFHTVTDSVNHPGPFEGDYSEVQTYQLPAGGCQ
jgi:hypothetical protein